MGSNDFRTEVYNLVALIPRGRVMTYGQIAALCGNPRAARMVGGIAHWAPCIGLPSCGVTGGTNLDGMQGVAEQQTESYKAYDKGAAEAATKQSAKSIGRVRGCAIRQADVLCPSCELPWHRVVNKQGNLARGYPGGRRAHARHLSAEGVKISDDYRVDVDSLLWRPEKFKSG
jgi:alkylated DNA nucleotide flippase Atl1